MKKIIGLIALTGVTAVACSMGTQDKESPAGKVASPLSSVILWGTPALKGAVSAVWNPVANDVDYRVSTAGTTTAQGPSYVAEQSLRNGSTLAVPSTTAEYQSLAPMSRDFLNTNACGSGSMTGVCCTGERNNLVGYASAEVIVKSDEGVANIPSESTNHYLKKLICGDDDGTTSAYPTNCISSFSDGTTWPSTGSGKRVRPDFDTEAMDIIRNFTGCKADATRGVYAFCEGVYRVSKSTGTLKVWESQSGTENDVASTFVGVGKPCATSDNAKVCIGKIAASTIGGNRYLGFSDRQPGGALAANSKLLTINGVARGTTTNVDNIRDLSYPLAVELFLNEDTGSTSDADETAFYNALYQNTGSAKSTWDTALTDEGFVKCSDSVALGCGSGVCPTSGGSNVNDGRGVGGSCASNARCSR